MGAFQSTDKAEPSMSSSSSADPTPPTTDEEETVPEQGQGEGEEEEEEEEAGECGFCLFMKGGGCKDTFVAWEDCVDQAEKNKEDIADKCFEVTSNLRKCMEAHADYYEPILRAEKRAEEDAIKELDREKEKAAAAAAETRAVVEVEGEGSGSSGSN